VRRLTAWIGGVAGGVVAYRFWRRHSQVAPEPSPDAVQAPEAAEPDDRADELRSRLAESREAEPAAAEAPAEPVVEEEPESPEDRRRRVHEEGRSALDDMKSE
jgi:hypothetical protein